MSNTNKLKAITHIRKTIKQNQNTKKHQLYSLKTNRPNGATDHKLRRIRLKTKIRKLRLRSPTITERLIKKQNYATPIRH